MIASEIITKCAQAFGVSRKKMLSRTRVIAACDARTLAFFLIVKQAESGFSKGRKLIELRRIAMSFNRRGSWYREALERYYQSIQYCPEFKRVAQPVIEYFERNRK